MFLSLNKKIIIAIVIFFVICFASLGFTLYSLYDSRLQDEQRYIHIKNTQYNELLYQYNKSISSNYTSEKKNSFKAPFIQKYEDERYKSLRNNLYLVLSCLIFFAIMIILMISFMHNLVFLPLAYFSQINRTIQQGIYKQRLQLPAKRIHDEFNNLEQTYNNMLDHIEAQINEINEQKDFLQNIIDGIPDAIRVFDSQGNIILTNKSYKNNLEQNKHHSEQHKCYASLLGKSYPCNTSITTCPLKALTHRKQIKFVQQLPWGKKQYLSVNASKMNTPEQPLIIESFRDLSNDIQFSHQQKISSLGFLTTAISHEIKNNLGSMKLILENIIHNKLKSTEQKKYLNLIYNQLIECINIPNRLLKIAKSSPDDIQDIQPLESIKDICELLDYEATHNGVKIKLIHTNKIPNIQGNETDFKMIILNLAQNAIKSMNTGGELILDVSNTAKYVNISVSDTGKGIANSHLPHIFDPFFSKHNNNSNQNIGLGLTIVKSLMNNFKGSITVQSKINKGTTFNLKFPYNNQK